MRKYAFLLTLFLSLLGSALRAVPDTMTITVEGNTFVKRTFTDGVLIFSNRSYALAGVPSDFNGFEFLASGGKIADEGTIIPSSDGFIYLIAPSGGLEGWTLIEGSEFYYSDVNQTKLSIYQKQVTASERITIPANTTFPGVSPLAKNIIYNDQKIYVKGDMIDIWPFVGGNAVFPQNTTFNLPTTFPSYLTGKKYAVALVEYPGVSQARADKACEITVATHYNTVSLPGWVYTGDYFAISSARNYYIYKYQYTTPGVWIDIPQRKTSGMVAPTLVFSDSIIWVNPLPLPGTVVTKSLDIKNVHITNPCFVILPDGDYLAGCTGALRYSGEAGGMSFFLSQDKGKTWKVQSENSIVMSFCNMFVHNNELYIMGPKGSYNDVVIRKSTDKGVTWTEPTDATNGILLTGGYYHSASVPVIVQNGRIWRAMENASNDSGSNKKAFVMSAPVDADLMKASSWTCTNQLMYNTTWLNGVGKEFKQWLEGNVVADKNGNVVNILRVDEDVHGGIAAITRISGPTQATFDPITDIVTFPGGGKKFTIRYDALTDKYWTLSNAEFDEDRVKTHNGIYKTGVPNGLLRNRLVLMCSDNLKDWTIKDTIVSSNNPFFHGFQYVDWNFDGEDIAAVSRTAFENEEGLPIRQHDANYLTFYRVEKFRDCLNAGLDSEKTNQWKIAVRDQQITITGNKMDLFDVTIYDITGRRVYSKTKTNEKLISARNFGKGLYIIVIDQNGDLFTQKIAVS